MTTDAKKEEIITPLVFFTHMVKLILHAETTPAVLLRWTRLWWVGSETRREKTA